MAGRHEEVSSPKFMVCFFVGLPQQLLLPWLHIFSRALHEQLPSLSARNARLGWKTICLPCFESLDPCIQVQGQRTRFACFDQSSSDLNTMNTSVAGQHIVQPTAVADSVDLFNMLSVSRLDWVLGI